MAAQIRLEHKIHVLTKKEELDTIRVPGKVDRPRHPLRDDHHGDRAGARRHRGAAGGVFRPRRGAVCTHVAGLRASGAAVATRARRSGQERRVFHHQRHGCDQQCADAARVYCGARVNAGAIVTRVLRDHPNHTVLIVCAGSGNSFNLEDFYGAGCFVERFADVLGPAGDLSDAARAGREDVFAVVPVLAGGRLSLG